MNILLTIIILVYLRIYFFDPHFTTALDCSDYGVNAKNFSNSQLNWETRLRACFAANPYDITQIPARV